MVNSNDFDYSLEPGKKSEITLHVEKHKPLITIITPYYNAKKYFQQTYNSVLNQTFPFFEWIIVNDGSTEKNTIQYLKELEKTDSRIKIYTIKNGGPVFARMYGVQKSNTDYLFFIDSDDLIEKNMIECCYWCIETDDKVSWVYSNSVGFGDEEYIWDVPFDTKTEKTENILCVTSLIRKKDFIECGGYDTKFKNFHEDWQLWLNFLSKEKIPAQMNFIGFWYRRQKGSRLHSIIENKEENKKSDYIIKKYSRKIKKNVLGHIYPFVKSSNNNKIVNILKDYYKNIKYDQNQILFLTNDLNDRVYIKEKNEITFISSRKQKYNEIQEIQKHGNFYDLSSFITIDHWYNFIKYIIKLKNIQKIYIGDDEYFRIIEGLIKKEFLDIEFISTNQTEDKKTGESSKRLYDEYINKYLDNLTIKKTRQINRIGRRFWKYKIYRNIINKLKNIKENFGYEKK